MAKDRQVERLAIGEHTGTAFWRSGRGIEERERYAEGIRIEVEDKWVCLHLASGELVRLRRSGRAANESAQIYLNMTLDQALREKAENYCFSTAGLGPPPPEEKIEMGKEWRRERLVSDEDWPAILAQRKIDAAKAQEELERRASEREKARMAGMAEWRSHGGQWLIRVDRRREGDVVTVRRKNGTSSRHILGGEQGPGLYASAGELGEGEAPARAQAPALAGRPSGIEIYRMFNKGEAQ